MMLDDCLASLEETSKPERVYELSEKSDTNVSQVHSQVSGDKQQPESLLQQDLSKGTSIDVNEMQFFDGHKFNSFQLQCVTLGK